MTDEVENGREVVSVIALLFASSVSEGVESRLGLVLEGRVAITASLRL